MEGDHFKLPSLDAKIKFVPKKSKPIQDGDVPPAVPVPEESSAPPSDFKVPANNESSADPKIVSVSKVPSPKSGSSIKCPYTEPKWSSAPDPDEQYSIEMLKSGQIVETVDGLEQRPYWLIGKLPENHIVMAHPTISRFHAVLQYRPEVIATKTEEQADQNISQNDEKTPAAAPSIEMGWYLYDLGSTHGSFVNKMKIPTKTYVRLRVGYLMTFGGSTRKLILQGPEADAEAESELTITEMKEQKRLRQEELIEKAKMEEKRKEAEGVSWGMSEDADEETDLSINPYASTNNEELYLQDPKKTLRGYFEREGLDLEYKVDELAVASFVCKIVLPICDSNGRELVAEVAHKGKKKDCVLQAAMEACRMLDRHGVLRQSHHESRKRKIERSDSDGDDEFFDRTGDVARKRSEKEAVQQSHAFSYDELLEQERELLKKLNDVDANISKYQQLERKHKERATAEDDLDDFMSNMSRDKYDKTDIRRLRVEAANIKKDHLKLQRLINIARPNDLPPLVVTSDASNTSGQEKKKLVLPLFGKRGTFKFGNAAPTKTTIPSTVEDTKPHTDEEEHEDDEEITEKQPEETTNDNPSKSIDKSAEIETNTSSVKEPPIIEPDGKNNHHPSMIKKSVQTKPPPSLSPDKHTSSQETPDGNPPTQRADDHESEKAAAKKKRSRPRQRTDRNRENVDFDETTELVSSDKYSTWLPPQGQTGDGSTTLNDKYGY